MSIDTIDATVIGERSHDATSSFIILFVFEGVK